MLDKVKATNETNNLSTGQQSTRQQKQFTSRQVNKLLDVMTAANKTNNLSTCQLRTCELKNETSGGYCGGVPPLPIPNREVKPTCADGTAMQCGRVGSRLLSAGAPRTVMSPGFLFLCLPIFPVSSLCLSGSPISANSYWELSSSFHPFTRKRNGTVFQSV